MVVKNCKALYCLASFLLVLSHIVFTICAIAWPTRLMEACGFFLFCALFVNIFCALVGTVFFRAKTPTLWVVGMMLVAIFGGQRIAIRVGRSIAESQFDSKFSTYLAASHKVRKCICGNTPTTNIREILGDPKGPWMDVGILEQGGHAWVQFTTTIGAYPYRAQGYVFAPCHETAVKNWYLTRGTEISKLRTHWYSFYMP